MAPFLDPLAYIWIENDTWTYFFSRLFMITEFTLWKLLADLTTLKSLLKSDSIIKSICPLSVLMEKWEYFNCFCLRKSNFTRNFFIFVTMISNLFQKRLMLLSSVFWKTGKRAIALKQFLLALKTKWAALQIENSPNLVRMKDIRSNNPSFISREKTEFI